MPADSWSSLTLATVLLPPERLETESVPSDHGFGLDDDERVPPALPDTSQENLDYAVAILRCRTSAPMARYREWVTESDVFEGIASRVRSGSRIECKMNFSIRTN